VATDDIEDLFESGPNQPYGLRYTQGTVLEWNDQTGENVISVRNGILRDLPTLGITDALTMVQGRVIGLLYVSKHAKPVIMGRFGSPGSADFFAGAMPDVSSAFYQVNTDAQLQTTTVGNFYSKMVAGHVINHDHVKFGARAQVSNLGVGTCTGAYRIQWYTTQPPNTANPTGGTLMAQATGLVGSTGTDFRGDFTYTWPAGMRRQLVFISYEPALTASNAAAAHWAAVMPSYFVGTDDIT
jgi:hypothetical protein